MKKKRQVIAMEDSLPKGEDPICCLEQLLREICCLSGTWVKDVTRKLLTLRLFSTINFQVGSNEVAPGSPREIRRHFRALGQLVKGSGPQDVFPLSYQLQGMIRKEIGRDNRSIPGSESGVTLKIWGILIMGQFT